MIQTLIESISIFPDTVQTILQISWGIFVFITPIFLTLKILQSKTFNAVFKEVRPFFKKLSELFKHSIDDPILKFPKISKAIGYISVFHSYLISLVLVVLFVGLMMLLTFNRESLSFLQFMGILSFNAVCIYVAAVIKTHASREIIRLRNE